MGESSEPRIDFIAEFTLKSLRLKPDKWARMTVSDEQRSFITSFIERGVHVQKCENRDWEIKNETENFKIEKITAISFSVINIVIVSPHEVS